MKKVQRLEQNTSGRDLIVGDIHGSFDLVLDAMQEARFDPRVDRLFSVGDLIDRGPGSSRCAKFLSKPYVYAVRGNHEDMLIDLYEKGDPGDTAIEAIVRATPQNGLEWWLKTDAKTRQDVLDAIRQMPLVIEVKTARGTVGIIHADVPAGMSWSAFLGLVEQGNQRAIETCLWGRARIKNQDTTGVCGVGRVFVGHTPQWNGITRLGNVYAIDTGAVFRDLGLAESGALTMAGLMASTQKIAAPKLTNNTIDLRGCDDRGKGMFGAYAKPQ